MPDSVLHPAPVSATKRRPRKSSTSASNEAPGGAAVDAASSTLSTFCTAPASQIDAGGGDRPSAFEGRSPFRSAPERPSARNEGKNELTFGS